MIYMPKCVIKQSSIVYNFNREKKFRTITEWAAKNTAYKPAAYYRREKIELDKEVENTNRDIKDTRNRKLKTLYDKDMIEWDKELNAQGLSLAKDWY